MALNEIKTNTTKGEVKDEPQINVSYKIRQVIFNIMEYTHIHIYPSVQFSSVQFGHTVMSDSL